MLFAEIAHTTKANGNTASKRVAMHQKQGVAAVGKKRLSRRRENMRLIDADALLENQPKGCYRTSDWINAAPTIDAIPVEWLEACGKRGSLMWIIADILIERWQKEQGART